jgi:hypothetical protein
MVYCVSVKDTYLNPIKKVKSTYLVVYHIFFSYCFDGFDIKNGVKRNCLKQRKGKTKTWPGFVPSMLPLLQESINQFVSWQKMYLPESFSLKLKSANLFFKKL